MTELEAQAKKISELEKKYQELENLVYKISHELTPRIWKLENPGKDISEEH